MSNIEYDISEMWWMWNQEKKDYILVSVDFLSMLGQSFVFCVARKTDFRPGSTTGVCERNAHRNPINFIGLGVRDVTKPYEIYMSR